MQRLLSFLPLLSLLGCTDPGSNDPFDGRMLSALGRLESTAGAPWVQGLALTGGRLPPALALLGPPEPGSFLPAAAVDQHFTWDVNTGSFAPTAPATNGSLEFSIYVPVAGTTQPALPLTELARLIFDDRYPEADITITPISSGGAWTVNVAPTLRQAQGILRNGIITLEAAFQRQQRPDSLVRVLSLTDGTSRTILNSYVAGVPGIEAIQVVLSLRHEGNQLDLEGIYDVGGPDLTVFLNGRDFARVTMTPQLGLIFTRYDGGELAPAEQELVAQAERLVGTSETVAQAMLGFVP